MTTGAQRQGGESGSDACTSAVSYHAAQTQPLISHQRIHVGEWLVGSKSFCAVVRCLVHLRVTLLMAGPVGFILLQQQTTRMQFLVV